MIEKTLYVVLSALDIHLFPAEIAQEQELPAVTYFRVKTMPTNTLKGTNRRHDNALFRVDVRAARYLPMAELSETIIEKVLESYGADGLLMENYDDLSENAVGVYHRILVFSLRELRDEGGE